MNKQQDQIAQYIDLAKNHEYSLAFINGEEADTVAKSGYLEKTESDEIRKNFAKIVKQKNYRFYNNPATFVGDIVLNDFFPDNSNNTNEGNMPIFLYSVAQIGLDINRRSFIPNFAAKHNIYQLASSGYQLELLQDKETFLQIARDFVSVPQTIEYKNIVDCENYLKNSKHILKPNLENSSRGVYLVESNEETQSYVQKNSLEFPDSKELVQDFIEGIEVEAPVLVGDCVIPLGIKVVQDNTAILDQKTIDSESYSYDDFPQNELYEKIENISIALAKRFNVKGFARFDFRIDKSNEIWLFDIAALPLITKQSSIQTCFDSMGLTEKDKYLSMIGAGLSNVI